MNKICLTLFITLLLLFSCGKKIEEKTSVKNIQQKQTVKKQTKQHLPAKKKKKDTRRVLIKVFENGFPSKFATVKIKKPGRKLKWWETQTDADGKAELTIPTYWKYFTVIAQKDNFALVTFKTNNIAPGSSPIEIEIEIGEPGVVITAELITDNYVPENLFAKITSDFYKDRQSLFAASATVCTNKKIIFPPIKKGLKKLKVLVAAKKFAKSYSDYFNTLDATNKTIKVKMLPEVKFFGHIIRKDGSPITNFYFTAKPRGVYEIAGNVGSVNARIRTDEHGYFSIYKLLPEFYKIKIRTDFNEYFETNVYLLSDKENEFEFILPNIETKIIKGIVKYEATDEPAENIKILCTTSLSQKDAIEFITGPDGKFEFETPLNEYHSAYLKINEPGVSKINYLVSGYNNSPITLLLKSTGIITGKITNENGEPISNVKLDFCPAEYNEKEKGYNIISKYPSNENGIYVVSNVAAPVTYVLSSVWGSRDYFLPYKFHKDKLEVNPGEITTYNIVMSKKPNIKIKLLDENGKIVFKYKLSVETKGKFHSSSSNNDISVNNETGWHKLQWFGGPQKIKMFLKAETTEGKVAVKDNINIEAGKSYNIILKIDPNLKPDVDGFVYDSEMKPLIDKRISVSSANKYLSVVTDHLGYFAVYGLGINPREIIHLQTSINNIYCSTNVLSGDNNIEWVLPKPCQITGRVFIENLNNPATNFAVNANLWGGKKHFTSSEGTFAISINSQNKEIYTFYIFVKGFAPKKMEVKLNKSDSLNLGDIIISDMPAAVSGRVIDQNGKPTEAYVNLKNAIDRTVNFSAKTTNGIYQIKNIPPGKYYVYAATYFTHNASENFELVSGDNYSVEDLILIETNIVNVEFKFLLPNGKPAANAYVEYPIGMTTDKNGLVKTKCCIKNNYTLNVKHENNTYFTEEFSIDKYTDKITLKLTPAATVAGTVTLDGKPLENGSLLFWSKNIRASAEINDGSFSLQIKPDNYVVALNGNKVIASVNLKQSSNNKINFVTGDATLVVEFSKTNKWQIVLCRKTDNFKIPIYEQSIFNKISDKIHNIQPGNYSVLALILSKNTLITNIYKDVTLKKGQTENVKF